MGYPITWFEVNGPVPEQTAKFYSELFGWHTEWLPDATYALIDTHAGSGINGGFGQTREGLPPHTVLYAEAPDIQILLDRAELLGAKTVVPRTVIPEMVTFAQFIDRQGNLIGLVEGDGSTRISDGENPPVDWFEIASTEPEASWAFYRELFDWKIEESSGDGYVHGRVDAGQGIPGGIGTSQRGQPASFVYAHVDGLKKFLEQAESLGGKTLIEPMQVDPETSIAIFLDPQGTAFGLYAHQD